MKRSRRIPTRRPWRRISLAALLGALFALAGLTFVPLAHHGLGPASVTAGGELGKGETVVTIPPLGTISARTHDLPLRLELSFTTIDFEELGSLATSPSGRRRLIEQMEGDLRSLVLASALRLLLGGAVIGALVAALVWHRNVRKILAGMGGGSVAVAACLGLSAFTYDIAAFDEPRYTGTIARAPQVIETVRERAGVLDQLGDRFEIATERLSGLLVLVAEPNLDPREESTSILHVSDIHSNPIGLDITAELARNFAVDAVVDTGDLASAELDTGELSSLAGPIDKRLAQAIDAIPLPYIFVPGNHDSQLLRRRLDAVDNVQVLDGDTAFVQGIEILGWADPTFATEAIPQDVKDEQRLAVAPDVARAVELHQPDVLAVHDERLAGESIGVVPLVLSGHLHERGLREEDGTLVLTVGSTGATGLKTFALETTRPYQAEIVYFRDGSVVAVDYITLDQTASDFVIERKTFEPAPDDGA